MVLRVLAPAALAAVIVGSATALFDLTTMVRKAERVAEVQSSNTAEWVEIPRLKINDAPAGEMPKVDLHLIVKKTVMMRVNSMPRNLDTGEIVCAGRTLSVELTPTEINRSVPLSDFSGLEECIWPPGRYATSLTWTLIDQATNVLLKPLVMESNEFIVGAKP